MLTFRKKWYSRLLKETEEIWNSYYEHPFIRGIGDGTLSKDRFSFYLIQDYLYLLDYSKIFALGVIKAPDEKTMQYFAKLLDGTLNSEMQIHRYYLKELNITEQDIKKIKPSLTNLSYTHYMMAVAHNGGMPEITVALLACSWSYYLIGKELEKSNNREENTFYTAWIDTYVSEDYQKFNNWLIEETDKFCDGLPEDHKLRLIDIFINTSRYEYNFWEMSYKKEL